MPYKQLQAALRYEWTEGRKQVKGSLRTMGGNVGSLNAALKTEMPGRLVVLHTNEMMVKKAFSFTFCYQIWHCGSGELPGRAGG